MCEHCEKQIKELEVIGKVGATAAIEAYLVALMDRNYEAAAAHAARALTLTSTLQLMKDATIMPVPDEIVVICVETLQKEVNLMNSIF